MSMTSNTTRKCSRLCWQSYLTGVNSIIKIELTVNLAARSYVVILTLFIEVFGVIYWRLSNMKALSIWLFNSVHGLLHVQEIKTKLAEPKGRQLIFFAENSSFFMSAPFMLVWDFQRV